MKAEVKTTGDKLNEALKKADDAAKDLKKTGENVKSAITSDITALKGAFEKTNAAETLKTAKEKAKEFGERMDENVNARPYHYIAGAAVAGLVLGLLIGRKK